MHKFLRSIGFSEIKRRAEMEELIDEIINEPTHRRTITDRDGTIHVEFRRLYGENFGIAVRGTCEDQETFVPDYFYPYLIGDHVSTMEPVEVEKHSDKESYAGICDDGKMGVVLIFFLQNAMDFRKRERTYYNALENRATILTGLSTAGKILMSIEPGMLRKTKDERTMRERNGRIAAAKNGDEAAMESLTLEDIDLYSELSERVQKEDLFSIVNTSFMPLGVESDQYSMIGEIVSCKEVRNLRTGEQVCLMELRCNGMAFDVCINRKDLLGEPMAGRRFRGDVWLQGNTDFANK